MDRSISPLPNPPSGQPLKLSNKLTGPLRSQSPLQAGRPPKKKKAVSSVEVTASLVASHDPVIQQDVSGSHHKMISDHHKPSSSSYHTSHTAAGFSSLSSCESDMEEVSMPTISHGNSTMRTTTTDGNGTLGELVKREKSGHDSSSSASDTSSSDSQSDDDSDEVILHHWCQGGLISPSF